MRQKDKNGGRHQAQTRRAAASPTRFARLIVEPLESRRVLTGAAPTITPHADVTFAEDGSTTLDFTVADADTPLGQLIVAATSGDTTLLPTDNLVLTDLGGGHRQLTVTPAADRNGTTTVTVSVSDGETLVPTQFTLNVTPVNDAPSFNVGADRVHYGPTSAQSIAGWATNISAGPNESGQALTFHTTNDNPALFSVQPTIAADGTLTYTPSGIYGTAVVTVSLQDDGGTANGGVNTSALQIFNVTFAQQPPLPAGSLDPTFDGDGQKFFISPYGSLDVVRDVVQQTDGKYVVVGIYDNGNNGNSNASAVARFNSNGSLDTSFGNGGFVRLNAYDGIYSVKLQADEKIVVGGFYDIHTTYVARLNSDGSLDTSFAADGEFTSDFGGTTSTIVTTVPLQTGLALQSDGKIVLTNFWRASGATVNSLLVARLTTIGTLDTSFNAVGYQRLSINAGGQTTPNSVAIQSDGKIVVAGVSATDVSSSTNDYFAARFNTDGTLDKSFADVGYVVTNVSTIATGNDIANRVAIQTDGKIVLAGQANNDFGLVRYNSDGTLDTSFDGDGKATTTFGSTDGAFGLALQSDGKIVAAGFSGASTSVYDFVLARYNANGSLDTSFDADGKRLLSLGSAGDQAYGVIVQSDGKLVVAGGAVLNATTGGDVALARLNTDGSLDTSFDADGIASLNIGPTSLTMRTVLSLADGSTLVGGSLERASSTSLSSSVFYGAVWHLLADGTLDTSFGTGGYFLATNSQLRAIGTLILQSDGKIVAISDGSRYACRLTAAGVIDSAYGSSGFVTLPTNFSAYSGVLQADGSLLVAGSYRNSSLDFAIARYTTAGILDPTFAASGITNFDFLTEDDVAFSVALQSDGKIVLAGYASNGHAEIAVARLNTDGTLDSSFRGTGKLTVTGGIYTEMARDVIVQSDGKIVVTGGISVAGSSTDPTIFRLNIDGSFDTSFGTGGITTSYVSTTYDSGYSLAQAADRSYYVAGYTAGATFVLHYLANGVLDMSFASGGVFKIDQSATTETMTGLAIQPDGRLVTAGYYLDPDWVSTTYFGTIYRILSQSTYMNPVPSITALADQATQEGLATSAIPFTVSHPTLSAAALSVSAMSSDQTLLPDSNLVLTHVGNGDWTIKATPAAGHWGSALVTVLVSDGTATYAETFTLDVINAAPTVVGAYARGFSWSDSFLAYLAANNLGDASHGYRLSNGANQLKALPWTNVNTITLQFSENVVINANDLTIVGASNGPAVPGLIGFAYNLANFTAVWSFASNLGRNKYLLHLGDTVVDAGGAALDGEWTVQSSTSSGDGVSGGDFNFRFNVLPSDVDRNGSVSSTEILQSRNWAGRGTLTAGFDPYRDFDGSGQIQATEILQARNRSSTGINGLNEPIVPGGSPQTAAATAPWLLTFDENGEQISPFAALSMDQLQPLVDEAVHRWQASGLVPVGTDWSQLHFAIADLGGYLGFTDPDGLVRIDDDGAGWGWFVDATPSDDAEFAATDDPAQQSALADGPAAGRMDLLTTILHEIGNFLGYRDVPVDQPPAVLMTALMPTDVRRIPAVPAPPIEPTSPETADVPPVDAPTPLVDAFSVAEASLFVTMPMTMSTPVSVGGAPASPVAATYVSEPAAPSVAPEHAALALWSTTSRASSMPSELLIRSLPRAMPSNPSPTTTAASPSVQLPHTPFVENLLRRSGGGRAPLRANAVASDPAGLQSIDRHSPPPA